MYPTIKMRNHGAVLASIAILLLSGFLLPKPAAFADDEICGTCTPEVRLSGTFSHRKENARVAIEGAGNNAAAYREDVNGANFTVTIAALPAGKYTVTIGAAETSAQSAGERVFDITSGDTVLAKDVDMIVKAFGSCGRRRRMRASHPCVVG